MIVSSSRRWRLVCGLPGVPYSLLSVAAFGQVEAAPPRGRHRARRSGGPRRHRRALLCAHTYVARYRGVLSTPNARIVTKPRQS